MQIQASRTGTDISQKKFRGHIAYAQENLIEYNMSAIQEKREYYRTVKLFMGSSFW